MNPGGLTGFIGSGPAQTFIDPFDNETAQIRMLLISFSAVPEIRTAVSFGRLLPIVLKFPLMTQIAGSIF